MMKQLRHSSPKTIPSNGHGPSPQEPHSWWPKLPRKWLIYLALALATGVGLVWAFRPAPIAVDVAQVQPGELQVAIHAEGKTRVRDRFVIAAETNGRLARVALSEGDAVAAGTVVAQLDPLPLNASVQEALGRLAEWQAQRAGVATQRPKAEAIAQAQSRTQAAQAQRQQAEAAVTEARAALTQAQRDRQRAQQLEATGAIARQDRERAELNETTRAQALETATLAVRSRAADVDVARAALAEIQQEQSDPDYLLQVYDARIASTEAELSKLRDEAARTDIRSPVAGIVLTVHQKSAQFVTAGTPLMEIGNATQMELVIDVLSTDAIRIKPGNRIWIKPGIESEAAPIAATVRTVEPSAFTKVSALGVEEQRVNIIGDFVEAEQPFGDGYRVDASIVVWSGTEILQTPISSLFRCEQSAWCVFVVEQGKAYQRPIQIGQRSDRHAEIISGLAAGETVILHPTEQIGHGRRVAARL
ncbi:HlyD family efflux transporter periplasmic adaptor subunit [Leptolyngbya sp. AN02str]